MTRDELVALEERLESDRVCNYGCGQPLCAAGLAELLVEQLHDHLTLLEQANAKAEQLANLARRLSRWVDQCSVISYADGVAFQYDLATAEDLLGGTGMLRPSDRDGAR